MSDTVAFYTLGCKLNYSETSTIGQQFLENGFKIKDFDQPADVYVINTCSVTAQADRECKQIVRRALRNNPEGFIIVTGCYAQLKPGDITNIAGVDLVLGNNEKFDIFKYSDSFHKKDLSCVHVSPNEEVNSTHIAFSTDADSRTRAFLKIQDGCDYKCSYCTIPKARGLSRSIASDEVAENFSRLIKSGYREVVLTGVNVGDFGNGADTDFYGLLKRLSEAEGDYRIRISSIEPNLLTDRILGLTGETERLCRHFHIPLQSGSRKILGLMQRRYKKEFYADLVNKVKERFPKAGIGVDVIVGFPGEGEEEFRETYEFLDSLPVSYLHVFTYSERPDTKALAMPESVDVIERKRRNSILRRLSEKKRFIFYEEMKGQRLKVLFEHENHNGMMRGFASNYVRVETQYNEELINKFSEVRILEADKDIVRGAVL